MESHQIGKAAIKRWGRVLSSILLFPVLYLLFVLIADFRANIPLLAAMEQFSSEVFILSLFPLATLRGRYPTTLELADMGIGHYVVMTVTVLAWWIVTSNLLRVGWKLTRSWLNPLPRRPKRIGFGLAIGIAILWLMLPVLPSSDSAQIRVDITQVVGPMPQHQRGFSQGGEVKMREPGYFEDAMERLSELHPQFVRIDHIYDYYNVYTIDTDGTPRYNWVELDRVIDAICSSGAEPFISVSYTPPALAQNTIYDLPTDLAAWEELVFQTVYHLNIERGLNIRYWEIWNEPNLSGFWVGTLEEYLALYQATARGALRADPSVHIGGPATSSRQDARTALLFVTERPWIIELARYTQRNELPLDFVSWHLYDPTPANYLRNVATHQSWVAELNPPPELFLTEWNWTGGRASAFDNGGTIAYLAATLATLADSSLDQAFFFEPVDGATGWDGFWGIMRADGAVKPTYRAFQLLSELSGDRLLTQNTHAHVGGLATREGNEVNILLWNYTGNPTPAEVVIVGLPVNSEILANIYGVAAEPGNSFYETGANDLRIGIAPLVLTRAGQRQLTVHMPPNSIRLIQFPIP